MKQIKLYNMILPPFMLFTITPLFWLISMVGNFIIDSIVILVTLYIFKKTNLKIYKKTIFSIWIYGYVADIIGALYLLIISYVASFINLTLELFRYDRSNNLFWQILDGINSAMNFSHFDSVWGVMFIISGILIAAVFIVIFNYHFVFKKRLKDILTKKQMIIASLTMAIATAPYTFLLPKELFY